VKFKLLLLHCPKLPKDEFKGREQSEDPAEACRVLRTLATWLKRGPRVKPRLTQDQKLQVALLKALGKRKKAKKLSWNIQSSGDDDDSSSSSGLDLNELRERTRKRKLKRELKKEEVPSDDDERPRKRRRGNHVADIRRLAAEETPEGNDSMALELGKLESSLSIPPPPPPKKKKRPRSVKDEPKEEPAESLGSVVPPAVPGLEAIEAEWAAEDSS